MVYSSQVAIVTNLSYAFGFEQGTLRQHAA